MDKIFCTTCGYVFGQDGDGGRDSVTIMLEVERNFDQCPKCAAPLELSIGDDPAGTVSLLKNVQERHTLEMPLGRQNRYTVMPSRQSSRPSLLSLIIFIAISVFLAEAVRQQPWWSTLALGWQILVGLGCLLIALFSTLGFQRMFRKKG